MGQWGRGADFLVMLIKYHRLRCGVRKRFHFSNGVAKRKAGVRGLLVGCALLGAIRMDMDT